MDIDKFSGCKCDFCNYEDSKPCLSCIKIIIYESIKDGVIEALFGADVHEAIKAGVKSSFDYEEIEGSIQEGIKQAFVSKSEINNCNEKKYKSRKTIIG